MEIQSLSFRNKVVILFLLISSSVIAQGYGKVLHWNNSEEFSTVKLKPFDWKSYPYTWDGKQLVIWTMFAGAGFLHGAREAYHADPYIFEKTYNVHQNSFWGSDAWKRNYQNNDPNQPHKHEYFGNVGRDVWHTFGFGSKSLLISGSFAIGIRRQPVKYRIVNLLIGIGIQSVFSSLTYNSLRN